MFSCSRIKDAGAEGASATTAELCLIDTAWWPVIRRVEVLAWSSERTGWPRPVGREQMEEEKLG